MTGKLLRDVFDPRNNSLNAIRLFLATAVIVSHSWAVGEFGIEPSAGKTTAGFWAVLGFFGISGFLITRSRLSGQPASRYYRARFLRIFPGFIVCITLTAFVLSPLSLILDRDGSWSLGEACRYLASNAALYPPHFSQEGLAGTLEGVAYPAMWNGSLWTLFWEAVCYVAVGCAASILPRKALPPAALGLFAACMGLRLLYDAHIVDLPLLVGRVLSLLVAFTAGATLFLYQDKIKVSRLTVAGTLLVLLAAIPLGLVQSLGAMAFIFLVVIAGCLLPLTRVGSKYDISYGMYIYAWPVQQFVMLVLGDSASLPMVIALSVIGTIPLAFLSFVLVEKPAQRWGAGRTERPKRPTPQRSLVG
ncbi:acyltransferase family protein [Pseudarthrobacter sulfonivorans]|uniref:acyltransferase family protein n=1 Tax=Pseudarthrobacter sulfonivorans TaxID=121292 RepID=UPI0027879CE3|nr:acyltransferase [Pseudarthrobacter sulfonivorans]MDQ0000528.1 peptidoglycan/LPS O-acetylase OafA/YrhL [Pseudarthrobacter sulfonivorans]